MIREGKLISRERRRIAPNGMNKQPETLNNNQLQRP
jgi:hypothetical protein